jgi:hypothetical protein
MVMNEILISFECAKLAKDKGFTLQSNPFGYITKFYEPKTGSIRSYGMHGRTTLDKLIYAPTQSLLQKWLREKHDIHVNCNVYYNPAVLDNKIYFEYFLSYKENNYEGFIHNRIVRMKKGADKMYNLYDTFEQALEQGLIESLKLIENEI